MHVHIGSALQYFDKKKDSYWCTRLESTYASSDDAHAILLIILFPLSLTLGSQH